MLALRQASSTTEGGTPPSSSSTRASSPVTQVAPPPSESAERDAEGRNHRAGDVVDGRYVLIEQLGKGGMGVVWKARSTALDVEVAVKLVKAATPSEEAFKRMAREAHAAARLGHPAMATVLDFGGTASGVPYVVMELLHGESLGEVLGREQRIDVQRAVGTLLPIMDGLREAHDKGIVHRDIKPENLFVSKTTRGRLQPKVLDFGIAKLDQPTDSNTKLTQDGAVLGSPGYFSPEQARGQTDIDFRTDIWSISVVLYELITGELPFKGPNYNALLMSILKDTPASIVPLGYGDDELWRIIHKGLQRDRTKRWASMGELGRALASWLYDRGVRADLASRSLQEVWLDARSASEHAGPPEPLGPEAPRRRVLSTLIKLRSSDTLAGETISSLRIGHRRVPTRVLGWGAAAFGVLAIIGSVLTQGGSGPVANAAASGAARGPALAAPAEPEGASSQPAVAPAVEPQKRAEAAPAESASPAAPSTKTASAQRAKARAATATGTPAPADATSAKARRATHTAGPRPASFVRPAAKKTIDQEFGF